MNQSGVDTAEESPLPNPSLRKNDHADLVFVLIAASVLLGILANFYMELQQYLILVMSLPLLFGFAGIVVYVTFFTNKRQEKRLLAFWFFAGFYLLIIGLLRWNLFSDQRFRSVLINQDLRYFMYAGCGIILANEVFRQRLIRLIQFLGLTSLIFGFLALKHMNLDLALIQERRQTWSLPYYYWWLSGCCYAMNYAYMRMTGKNKLAGIGSLLAYVVCGALFLKKSVIVDTLLLLIICELLASKARKRRGALKRILAIITLIGLLAVVLYLLAESVPLVSDLINSYAERLRQASASYDRVFEFQQYWRQASVPDIIFGKGYGNYAYLSSMYGTGNYLANAMHIGYLDILYVGGVPYCIFWLGIIAAVIRRLMFINSMNAFETACLAASILMIFSLLFEMSRGMSIEPVLTFTAIGTVLSVNPVKKGNQGPHENLLQRQAVL